MRSYAGLGRGPWNPSVGDRRAQRLLDVDARSRSTEEEHVDACVGGPDGHVSDQPERSHRATVERIGDDDTIEAQLVAQQVVDDFAGHDRGLAVERGVFGARHHHEVGSGCDSRRERREVGRSQHVGRQIDDAGRDVGVGHCCTEPWEVFEGGRDTSVVQAVDERRDVLADDCGIGAERASLRVPRTNRRVRCRRPVRDRRRRPKRAASWQLRRPGRGSWLGLAGPTPLPRPQAGRGCGGCRHPPDRSRSSPVRGRPPRRLPPGWRPRCESRSRGPARSCRTTALPKLRRRAAGRGGRRERRDLGSCTAHGPRRVGRQCGRWTASTSRRARWWWSSTPASGMTSGEGMTSTARSEGSSSPVRGIVGLVSGLVDAVVVADVDPGRVQAAVEASSARQHRARSRPARAITRSVVVARARRSSAGCDRWIVGVEVRRASGPVGDASPELGGSDDLDLGPE